MIQLNEASGKAMDTSSYSAKSEVGSEIRVHLKIFHRPHSLMSLDLFNTTGDADEIGLPKNNVWYFNGYDLDSAFDKYFSNPTVSRRI